MTPERCDKRGIFGRRICRFRARYDETPPDSIEGFSYQGRNLQQVLAGLRRKTYVRDVCETCGLLIEREQRS